MQPYGPVTPTVRKKLRERAKQIDGASAVRIAVDGVGLQKFDRKSKQIRPVPLPRGAEPYFRPAASFWWQDHDVYRMATGLLLSGRTTAGAFLPVRIGGVLLCMANEEPWGWCVQ